MEMCVFITVLMCVVSSTATAQDCAVNYTAQPPTEFDCNPTGQRILLSCVVTPLGTSVSWYHTSDPMKAGLQGDELMDDIDGYSVIDNSNGASRRVHLGFTVSNFTTGFYWCGITSGDYRSSTITPICTQFNSTLPMCDLFDVNQQISDVHHYETECAEVDSPTQFPRPPFPENCIPVPSPSIVNTIDHSDAFRSTILTILSSRSVSFSTLTISSPSLVNTIDHSDAFRSTILTTLSSRSVSSSTLTASLLSISSTSTPAVESDQSCNGQKVIFGLIGVCVFLAVVTMITCGAFIMYCFLTKANGVHGIKGTYSRPVELCRSCISSTTGTRSDDQLDEHPPIYSEVPNDPVIKQSDDMIMSRNAVYLNNKTWLK